MNRVIALVLGALVLAGLFIALRPDAQVAEPQDRTIEVTITGDSMTPKDIAVNQGDTVTLRVTSDHEMELHIHGYDEEVELEPGVPTAETFEAETEGRFDIENEETHTELGTLTVRVPQGG